MNPIELFSRIVVGMPFIGTGPLMGVVAWLVIGGLFAAEYLPRPRLARCKR